MFFSVKKYKQLFYILLKHEFHAHYHIMILIKSPWGFRKKSEQVAPLLQFDCRISILWNLLAWLCYRVSLRDHLQGIHSNQNLSVCICSAVAASAFYGLEQLRSVRSRLFVWFSCSWSLPRSPARKRNWMKTEEGWAHVKERGWDWQ